MRAAGQQIGAVAKRSGVSVKTIRFYCDQGLLHPASRSEGRYRLFDASIYEDLSLIRTLRAIEIPLATIRTVLEARRSGICTCENLQTTIRDKTGEIHQRIEDLKALEAELVRMLSSWETCGRPSPQDHQDKVRGPARTRPIRSPGGA
ncbi:MerR family transcriptional regulator [Cyanobium sp. NIES-981]|uniref:MerR family transcriptional regulator n=1 Tax=Cyanobium sp. NIES-981 TaxID=1851505 RepID=UPI0007DCCB5F|nr:MerR family transcriptional regulator [Cyanobium sp. NIES-981]SBO44432.1 Transcriptional regulator, MerR family [Cyanobium sp. NIES-981]